MSNYQTMLVSESISSIEVAHRTFGEKTPSGATRVVLHPGRRLFRWFTPIPAGMHALLFKHGRFVKIVEPGMTFLAPWSHVKYLVTQQYTVFDCPVKDCPTADNVMVQIDTMLVFRIVDPQTFIFRTSPEKLAIRLQQLQAEAVRGLARSVSYRDVYTLSGKSTDDMRRTMNDSSMSMGVEVKSVTITQVTVPAEIAKNLEQATTFHTLQEEQKKQQEYELKRINDQDELNRKKEDYKNERIAADKEAENKRAEMRKEIDLLNGKTQQMVSEIQAQQHANHNEVVAGAELFVANRQAEKEKVLKAMNAEAEASMAATREEASAHCERVLSEAKLHEAQNRAKALEIEAETEKEAAEKLRVKREFERAQQRVEVLKSLASNSSTFITGKQGVISASTLAKQAVSAEARKKALDASLDVMYGTQKR